MAASTDVVVVGGGIAGAALAYALASGGVGVTILESSVEYHDRVRGETMVPWGVKEARELGVERILLDAGAHLAPIWTRYAGNSEPFDIPMSLMVPGVDGTLNLGHPGACQALVDAAAEAGAEVIRGVRDVKIALGDPVGVTWSTDPAHERRASLVVGADGRASVVRKQAGITLRRQEPVNYISGLLVGGLEGVPDDHDVLADQSDLSFLMFHQGAGRARVYLVSGLSGQHRFAGRDGARRFLESCAPDGYPWTPEVRLSAAVGPCATYPGDDTWTDEPYVDGTVLIGDAAGHNDPIIGQGLSIAMRDARTVRDVVLQGGRRAADFAGYGQERAARMERLRLAADIFSVQIEDASNRRARRELVQQKMAEMDPELFPLLIGVFSGPETIPAELLRTDLLDQIRAA